MTMPRFDGWHAIGRFPRGDPDGVGSWLLHNGGEAMMLEVPPGLTVTPVRRALKATGCRLMFVTASHVHDDQLDRDVWAALRKAFPAAAFIRPRKGQCTERQLHLGGESVWILQTSKHSWRDVLTVFRGVAMTGDIELGTVDTVDPVVHVDVRRASMDYLAGFPTRTGCKIHSIISAHVNDVRCSVVWPALFACDHPRAFTVSASRYDGTAHT